MKTQLWKCFQNDFSCCLVLNSQRFMECMTKVSRNKTKTLSLYCSLLILSRMFSVEYIICIVLSVRCIDSFYLGAVIVYEYKKYFRISLYGVEIRRKQKWSETKLRSQMFQDIGTEITQWFILELNHFFLILFFVSKRLVALELIFNTIKAWPRYEKDNLNF